MHPTFTCVSVSPGTALSVAPCFSVRRWAPLLYQQDQHPQVCLSANRNRETRSSAHAKAPHPVLFASPFLHVSAGVMCANRGTPAVVQPHPGNVSGTTMRLRPRGQHGEETADTAGQGGGGGGLNFIQRFITQPPAGR